MKNFTLIAIRFPAVFVKVILQVALSLVNLNVAGSIVRSIVKN